MIIKLKLVYPSLFSMLILFILFLIGCGRSKEDSTRLVIDKDKNIELTLPDTVASGELKSVQSNIASYFDSKERFVIDTISTLSAASLALEAKARDLQNRLMQLLPKVSITTGLGENKMTRNYYIIEGDIKVDRDELYYYCLKRLQKPDTTTVDKVRSRKLTIVTDKSGNPSIWPIGTTIKYTVMRSSFSSRSLYDLVKKEMRNAANDWMRTCNIRFEYVPNLDQSEIDLESYPSQILFVVRQLNVDGDFIAQSFFPADPPYKRMLLLDNTFFSSSYNKTGVLRHELGHILGFRHEHLWSDDLSCSGESIVDGEFGAKPTTKYDPFSVMHYPCGPNSDNYLIELTEFDKAGARKIYPFN